MRIRLSVVHWKCHRQLNKLLGKGIEDSAVGCRRSAGEEIEDSAIRLSAVGCWRSAGEGIEDSAVGCRLSAVHRKVKIMKEVKEEVSKKK